jgi:serine/threonine protein kinase
MASAPFSREFEAGRKLIHPCIVPVHAFITTTKRSEAGLVMRHMEGDLLYDVLGHVRIGNPLPFWTYTDIAMIVAGIVYRFRFIYSTGSAQRGLKPVNLLIDKVDRWFIADLGSVRLPTGANGLFSSDRDWDDALSSWAEAAHMHGDRPFQEGRQSIQK